MTEEGYPERREGCQSEGGWVRWQGARKQAGGRRGSQSQEQACPWEQSSVTPFLALKMAEGPRGQGAAGALWKLEEEAKELLPGTLLTLCS